MNAVRLKWLSLSVLCSMLLAGLTAWQVTDWALHRHGLNHAERQHLEPDFHAWMHAHLDITPSNTPPWNPWKVNLSKNAPA